MKGRPTVTAAASPGPAATFIPASMMGWLIPNISVKVVLIGPLGIVVFVWGEERCGEGVGGNVAEE